MPAQNPPRRPNGEYANYLAPASAAHALADAPEIVHRPRNRAELTRALRQRHSLHGTRHRVVVTAAALRQVNGRDPDRIVVEGPADGNELVVQVDSGHGVFTVVGGHVAVEPGPGCGGIGVVAEGGHALVYADAGYVTAVDVGQGGACHVVAEPGSRGRVFTWDGAYSTWEGDPGADLTWQFAGDAVTIDSGLPDPETGRERFASWQDGWYWRSERRR